MSAESASVLVEPKPRMSPVPRWQILALFLRARGMLMSAVLVLASCGLLALLEDWAGKTAIRQVLLMQLVPVLVAALIGVSAWSPFGEPERTAARSLPGLRGAHIGSLLVMSIGLSIWQVSRWENFAPKVDLEWVVARNIIGLTGVALVAGRLIDARLSWVAPLVMGVLASSYILSVGGNDLDKMWDPAWWLWNGQSSDALLSWTIALALGIGGFGWMCLSGPKDATGEET